MARKDERKKGWKEGRNLLHHPREHVSPPGIYISQNKGGSIYITLQVGGVYISRSVKGGHLLHRRIEHVSPRGIYISQSRGGSVYIMLEVHILE